ncbi:MAG: hypothetical protein PHT41_05085 [Candidatus Omnitrophica bacterium]|nr:hypothetical protein [Candidatus Omnitrophota bacterium]MDD5238309.1 hypothetical protein [Candidatus Omnitrophota bacterium]
MAYKEKKEAAKGRKNLRIKFFVEPKLIKRGSLKEVTFASSLGQGESLPGPTPR